MFSSKDVPWKGGPGHYGKSVISPQAVNITQSIESHIEAYAPGASGQKHGHLNSAVFYVLKGHGHDVHDGRHIPWKAGDVMLVENACVHQHFNEFEGRGSDPAGVQGEAAVPVHAPAVPEDRGMAVENSAQGRGELQAAGGHLRERIMATVFTDKGPALSGTKTATFRADEARQSLEFRKQYESRTNVVLAEDMPWEHSADGLIKHLVHEKLNTREMCVEAYMQFLKPGEKSGVHRHMWEELLFVVEGSGYDLHWDLKWDCLEAFQWEWAAGAEGVFLEARRLHLHSAVHQPSARRRRSRGLPADRDVEPHHQGDGLRLVRSGRGRGGLRCGDEGERRRVVGRPRLKPSRIPPRFCRRAGRTPPMTSGRWRRDS